VDDVTRIARTGQPVMIVVNSVLKVNGALTTKQQTTFPLVRQGNRIWGRPLVEGGF
jgi:hypothetical protein